MVGEYRTKVEYIAALILTSQGGVMFGSVSTVQKVEYIAALINDSGGVSCSVSTAQKVEYIAAPN